MSQNITIRGIYQMNITEMSTEQRKKLREDSKIKFEKKYVAFVKDNPKLASVVKHAPNNFKKQYIEALLGELSNKQAIKVKCVECSGFSNDEVKNCTVRACPLWKVRPYQ